MTTTGDPRLICAVYTVSRCQLLEISKYPSITLPKRWGAEPDYYSDAVITKMYFEKLSTQSAKYRAIYTMRIRSTVCI